MPSSPDNPNPLDAATIDAVVRRRAAMHGDRIAYRFLADGEAVTDECTYAELDARARRLAGWLQKSGLRGEPVLLVFPEGIDYIAAFLGCLYAGAIATPVSPPRRNRRQSRLESIAKDSGARCVLTDSASHERYRGLIEGTPDLEKLDWVAIDAIDAHHQQLWTEPLADPAATAFLQYTSGSTGQPKGVVVSHANVMENQRLITRAFGQDESVVVAGWLPIYHDMGLIGNVLHPLFLGGSLVFMPPVAFLQKPIRWLRMIHGHAATIAGGPDFAFDLCSRETTAEERATLDLSKWQVAFNGSEPIHAATLDRFAEEFAPHGFRDTAFCPCFGMAETTLLVSGSRKTNAAKLVQVDAERLSAGEFKVTVGGRALVGSGPPDEAVRIEIVDPETCKPQPPDTIGEVWVAGETVARGYWNQPELTAETFAAEISTGDGAKFLRTGDLGLVHEGELFITGRLKDLIIVRGANHYPQDLERAAEAAHPALVAGGAAAFSVDRGGEEAVCIVQEVERSAVRRVPREEVFRAIRQAVADEHELALAEILLIRPGALPRTSSGKKQRRQTRQLYLDGRLKPIASNQSDTSPAAGVSVDRENVNDPKLRRQVAELEDWLIARIAERRGLAKDSIDPSEPFARYGLDSLAAVRLSGQLSDKLGRDVPPTLAYDYPSPAAMARYLVLGESASEDVSLIRSNDDEPLAVIGVGCRLPGGNGPEAYWRSLLNGVCSIGPAPRDRWPNAEGDALPGGYLPAIDQFDPAHFGVSPREADQMDPQQRLLLEVAWETLEHAGRRTDRVRGQSLGVFVGVSAGDYSRLQAEVGAKLDPYSAIGGSLALIANRLSYTLDLRGPSLAIDTACSSSLVAVHQAAEAIRRGACDTALAGGVSLIVSPSPTASLQGAGMLSPGGVSLAFCRGGDGFVRGEGCGLVLLKRLGAAIADGDRVLCVLRGTAVNQDGRSNGLTAPSGPSQQGVIRRALAVSGLKPSDIDYLEAHGTGTELGDPTEMGALAAVFGGRDGERERPLLVGTAKTNVGHLEGAAGVAGLIKACLSLAHEELPPHPSFDPNDKDGPFGPSPHIDWTKPIEVPNKRTDWKRTENHVRRAGVSSFGFGGTNAHVIVEEAPALSVASCPLSVGERWVTLSARTPAALASLAERYARELPEAELERIAYAANTGRAALAERLAIRASTREELIERLTSQPSAHVRRGAASRTRPIGWLFGGQGGCRPGMGKELYDRYDAFRAAWDACDEVIQSCWPRRLKTICWDEPEFLSGVDAQVALVAWQIALAELWKTWAGAPAWAGGHSLGEFAAAVTAGVLDRDDALKLVCKRAELLDRLTTRGGMLAVMAPREEVESQLPSGLSIAAINGPRQTVVSGDLAALAAFEADLKSKRLRAKRLATSHAFHSPLVEPVLDEFKAFATRVTMRPPKIGFLSTLTGRPLESVPSSDYWARQMREPVAWEAAIGHAPGDDLRLELSPTPVLKALIKGDVHTAAGWKEGEEATEAETTAAALWTRGAEIDFRAVHPKQRLSVALPTYPFERSRHWFKAPAKRSADAGEPVHPLLGSKLDLAGEALVFETDLAQIEWLRDHRLRDKPTLPAVAYLELAWAAGREVDRQANWDVAQLELLRPLSLDREDPLRVQTVATPDEQGHRIEVLSREEDGWRLAARCRIERRGPETIEPPVGDDSLEARDLEALYAAAESAGLAYGPTFRGVVKLKGRPGLAQATLALPQTFDPTGYLLPPPTADAALQTTAATLPQGHAYLPKKIQRARLLESEGDEPLKAIVQLSGVYSEDNPEVSANVFIQTDSGKPVAEFTGVTLTRLAGRAPSRFFRTVWDAQPRKAELSPPPLVTAETIADRLRRRIPEVIEQTGIANRPELLATLEQMSAEYAAAAIAALDGDGSLASAKAFSTEELISLLGIAPTKHRLFGRLLAILADENRLNRTGGKWRATEPFAAPTFDLCELRRRFPTGRPELALVAACGERLADVLRDEIDPLTLLFPAEGGGAADLYRHSTGAVALNDLAADAVAALIDSLPPGRSLRVLEIGAGTGATTERVINRVGLDRLNYTFTDVAPGFLAAARRRLPQTGQIDFRVLDIERDPTEQGFEPASFDVVVAANVLHATADLAATTARARQLLAPGGQLVLVEGTRPTRWLDITFGMTDGWWRFEDASLRADYPLLSVDKWRSLLTSIGFGAADAVAPVAEASESIAENHVIVATADDAGAAPMAKGEELETSVVVSCPEEAEAVVAAIGKLGGIANSIDLTDLASVSKRSVFIADNTSLSAEDGERLCGQLLTVLKQAHRSPEGGGVTLVTRGGVAVDGGEEAVNPAHAALWGFMRAAAREAPAVVHRCIDVPGDRPLNADALAQELAAPATEPEVALRTSGRFLRRLVDASPGHQPDRARALRIAERGSLDGLTLEDQPPRPPAAGEVQIRVAAAGLNFRDVLNTLGQYPGEPPLGAELAGVVSAVGDGACEFSVGDRVIAVAPEAMADFATAPATAVLPLPESLPLADAATLPVAYGTASLALEQLAGIKRGDRVLVHAATGGVGRAALGLARAAGAEAFATASIGKQLVLRRLGVDRVYDSRSDEFADEILADTAGEGVDIVLNALGEDLHESNLRTLKRGGVLVDLTKPSRDLAAETARLRPDVTYHLVDLAATWRDSPETIRGLLTPIVRRVASGELRPLPHRVFPLGEAAGAMRLMQRAGHTGKLLLAPEPDELESHTPRGYFDSGDVCVITGGFGDLGLLTAETLAKQGCQKIALIGRRPPSGAASQKIDGLRESGVQVLALQADVSDREQLEIALGQAREIGVIRGVVHSAGKLDDALVADLTPEKVASVFAAKAHGAWNLHHLTADDPLRLFTVYSSVASVLGAPGQANHSAANAFLDGLMARRRSEGKPGLTINWGPWRGIGEAARRGVDARTDLGGIELLSPADGRHAIAGLLTSAAGQRMVVPWDLRRLPDWLRAAPLLARLAPRTGEDPRPGSTAFIKNYRETPDFRRQALVVDHLRQQLATVLGMASGAGIPPGAAMFDLGLDSLTTLELKNALRHSLGIDVPSNLAFDFPTIDRFGAELHRRLGAESSDGLGGDGDGHDKAQSDKEDAPSGAPELGDEQLFIWQSHDGPSPSLVEEPAAVWDDLAALEDELKSWGEAP